MSTTEELEFDYNAYFDKHGVDPRKIHGKAERERRLRAAMERIALKEKGCRTKTTEEPEFDYYTYFKGYKPRPDQIHRGPAEREKRLKAAMERKRIAERK